jgi:rubrerythrin
MKLKPVAPFALLVGLLLIVPPASHAEPAKKKLDDKTRNALVRAVEDERAVQRLYEAILERHGADTKPFKKILEAEKKHEADLLRLCERYGVEVPAAGAKAVEVPATVEAACALAARTEEDSATLYAGFGEVASVAQVRKTFERLRTVSAEKHLPAFSWCVENKGQYKRPAGSVARCDSCGMAGCGCSDKGPAEAGAAPQEKAQGCGCMRGKQQPDS